jgi:pilus assembly protein Flp/PilA
VSVSRPAERSGIAFIPVRALLPMAQAEPARTPGMVKFINNLRALISDERGVTAMEYGLIAGLVAIVIIGSVTTVGTSLSTTFTNVAAALP